MGEAPERQTLCWSLAFGSNVRGVRTKQNSRWQDVFFFARESLFQGFQNKLTSDSVCAVVNKRRQVPAAGSRFHIIVNRSR